MGLGLPAVVSPTGAPPPHSLGRGKQRPGARPLHQGRLVPRARRVPQGGDLADAQDAAPAGQPRTGGVEVGQGDHRADVAHPEPRPGGMVEVAVGGGHRAQQFFGPLGPSRVRQHGDDLRSTHGLLIDSDHSAGMA